jgi:hypothetical protein
LVTSDIVLDEDETVLDGLRRVSDGLRQERDTARAEAERWRLTAEERGLALARAEERAAGKDALIEEPRGQLEHERAMAARPWWKRWLTG